MSTTPDRPQAPERIACHICQKEIPESEATSSEATDYVVHFCGIECYDQWRGDQARYDDRPPPPHHK